VKSLLFYMMLNCLYMLCLFLISIYIKSTAGDLNETYFVGNVDEASKQLVRCTYECLEKAIAIGGIIYNFDLIYSLYMLSFKRKQEEFLLFAVPYTFYKTLISYL